MESIRCKAEIASDQWCGHRVGDTSSMYASSMFRRMFKCTVYIILNITGDPRFQSKLMAKTSFTPVVCALGQAGLGSTTDIAFWHHNTGEIWDHLYTMSIERAPVNILAIFVAPKFSIWAFLLHSANSQKSLDPSIRVPLAASRQSKNTKTRPLIPMPYILQDRKGVYTLRNAKYKRPRHFWIS